MGREHRLWDYSTPIHDAAVKQPTTWWAGMLGRDVGRDRVEEEEIALPRREERGCVWGDRGALEEIQTVLFGRTALEGLRYVPVNE
jgi:hypothetical protein